MNFARALLPAVASCLLATSTLCSVAEATTVNFAFDENGTPEATGSFSYASSNPVLSYADLTAFTLTIGSTQYDLAYALSASDYAYFAYDTAAHQFVPGSASGCYGGPFESLLSAVGDCFANGGYYIRPADSAGISEFTQGIYDEPYNSVVYDGHVSNLGGTRVPEPASIALLAGTGLFAAASLRRRQRAISR
jgi:hypothetical protein